VHLEVEPILRQHDRAIRTVKNLPHWLEALHQYPFEKASYTASVIRDLSPEA
jgi:hypothetical protein